MKRAPDQFLIVALLGAFAIYLAAGAIVVAEDDKFHSFRFAAAALSSGALALFLFQGRRWARWIAMGWAIDVLLNMLAAVAFGEELVSDDRVPALFPLGMGAAAIAALIALGRPGARIRFEPDWTTPLHHAYRWTAISAAACATHAVLAGMFGVVQNIWTPVIAAVLMLLAIALLTGARVLGLSIAAAALIAQGAAEYVVIPYLPVSGGLTNPGGSDAWCYFLGNASSVLWAPALFIALAAHAFAAPQLIIKGYLSRAGGAIVFAILAIGLTGGVLAVVDRIARNNDEDKMRVEAISEPLEVPEFCVRPSCLLVERDARPSSAVLAAAKGAVAGPSCLRGQPNQMIQSISRLEYLETGEATITVDTWCGCWWNGATKAYKSSRDK